MFDFAWSEIGVIAVVALIFIGPKDMPVAIKAMTGALKKARRMAGEFQTHVDELVREADLQEVRDSLSEIRNFNVSRAVEKYVDDDGSLRRSFDDPFADTASTTATSTVPLDQAFVDVQERPEIGVDADAAADAEPAEAPAPLARRSDAPAFIPPGFALLSPTAKPADDPAPAKPADEPPAFVPPAFARAAAAPSAPRP